MKSFFKRQALIASCYGIVVGYLQVIALIILGVYGSLMGEIRNFWALAFMLTVYSAFTFFFYCCLGWLGLGDIFEPKPLLKNAWEFYKDSWKPRSERKWR